MEHRLARVEKKLDDVQDAIVALARVEERLTTVFNRQTNIEDKVNSMDAMMNELTAKTNNRFAERVFWLIIVALVGVFFNV
jgi:chromosome segregation ATPase|tara:strand:- start:3985 stop:4227 length:243 start_codon:yes stop_codon:yes gene_type:complete